MNILLDDVPDCDCQNECLDSPEFQVGSMVFALHEAINLLADMSADPEYARFVRLEYADLCLCEHRLSRLTRTLSKEHS